MATRQWYYSIGGKQTGPISPCEISICANRENASTGTSEITGLLVHELLHCWQNCHGRGSFDCESSICNEVLSYSRQAPE